MRFAKYHGAGNDFVMLDDPDGRLGPPGSLDAAFVRAACDRHTGVGADGLIRVIGADGDPETRAAGAGARMDYYNADGGTAEMCGNGVRCVVLLQQRAGRFGTSPQRVLTRAGVVDVRAEPDGRVRVGMGVPKLTRPEVPMTGDGPSTRVAVEIERGLVVEGTGVSMGNPHFVVFTADLGRDLDDELVAGLGPRLEVHAAFPERTNVGFAHVLAPDEIRLRVWERGVGETMACGSGACAAVAAASTLGLTGRRVVVHARGGRLDLEWADDGRIWMTGPAEVVFEGEFDRAWLIERGVDRLDAAVPS